MPWIESGVDLVGTRWDISQLKSPLVVRNRVVRVVGNQPPTFHVGMKTTLHHKDPAAFGHPDGLGYRRPLIMRVDMRTQSRLARVAFAERQRDVEQDPWAQVCSSAP